MSTRSRRQTRRLRLGTPVLRRPPVHNEVRRFEKAQWARTRRAPDLLIPVFMEIVRRRSSLLFAEEAREAEAAAAAERARPTWASRYAELTADRALVSDRPEYLTDSWESASSHEDVYARLEESMRTPYVDDTPVVTPAESIPIIITPAGAVS